MPSFCLCMCPSLPLSLPLACAHAFSTTRTRMRAQAAVDGAQELVQRLGSAPEGQKRGGTLAKIRFWIKSAEQEIANAHLLIEDARQDLNPSVGDKRPHPASALANLDRARGLLYKAYDTSSASPHALPEEEQIRELELLAKEFALEEERMGDLAMAAAAVCMAEGRHDDARSKEKEGKLYFVRAGVQHARQADMTVLSQEISRQEGAAGKGSAMLPLVEEKVHARQILDAMAQLLEAEELLRSANVHQPTCPLHELMDEVARLRAVSERVIAKARAGYEQAVFIDIAPLLDQDKLAEAKTVIDATFELVKGVLPHEQTRAMAPLVSRLQELCNALIPKMEGFVHDATQHVNAAELHHASLCIDEAEVLSAGAPRDHPAHSSFVPVLQRLRLKIVEVGEKMVLVERKIAQAYRLVKDNACGAHPLLKAAKALLHELFPGFSCMLVHLCVHVCMCICCLQML